MPQRSVQFPLQGQSQEEPSEGGWRKKRGCDAQPQGSLSLPRQKPRTSFQRTEQKALEVPDDSDCHSRPFALLSHKLPLLPSTPSTKSCPACVQTPLLVGFAFCFVLFFPWGQGETEDQWAKFLTSAQRVEPKETEHVRSRFREGSS